MIEDPPLLQIRRRFNRPTAAQVQAFAGLQTGFVVDALGGRGALDRHVKPIGGSAPFCGVALPCFCGPDDNLAAFGTLSVAQPGDVVLAAAEGFDKAAVIGDLMLGMMKNVGIAAFVTDGCVRDQRGLQAVGLPCYAAGVTPNSPVRNGPGTVGFPTVVGGVTVRAGDIVLGDEDGVVVVPAERIEATIARIEVVRAAEAAFEAKVKAGLKIPDFVQALIDSGKFLDVD
ncbi:RraA family protein [Labrys monachus]|uniref:Putative 4-hydroxy-4-methyl-2-oxoglutarate aldolase n=1 Tax=Labrys monachus TaxID=217067 RepID=A0ABU0F9Y9_9HYPH|nr:RraA family protein [Labrys monachus]MDQ0391437.1 4-hydroxy-4-methyl-2-oxoglutarate aldolase [Labrys monachus]